MSNHNSKLEIDVELAKQKYPSASRPQGSYHIFSGHIISNLAPVSQGVLVATRVEAYKIPAKDFKPSRNRTFENAQADGINYDVLQHL